MEQKEFWHNRRKAMPFLLIGPFMCFAPGASDADKWFAIILTLLASIFLMLDAFAYADRTTDLLGKKR